ncbi:hypothetical protein EJB05_53031, partial [Eragrostis curvula]
MTADVLPCSSEANTSSLPSDSARQASQSLALVACPHGSSDSRVSEIDIQAILSSLNSDLQEMSPLDSFAQRLRLPKVELSLSNLDPEVLLRSLIPQQIKSITLTQACACRSQHFDDEVSKISSLEASLARADEALRVSSSAVSKLECETATLQSAVSGHDEYLSLLEKTIRDKKLLLEKEELFRNLLSSRLSDLTRSKAVGACYPSPLMPWVVMESLWDRLPRGVVKELVRGGFKRRDVLPQDLVDHFAKLDRLTRRHALIEVPAQPVPLAIVPPANLVSWLRLMPSDRRSSEENVKKKAKTHKSSSKNGSDKVVGEARSRRLASAPSSKDSAVRSTSFKQAISIRPPKVYSLIDIITGPKGVSQSSSVKTLSASKEIPSKIFASPARGTSSSSADAGKSMAPEKAKAQDKNAEAAATLSDTSGSKAKILDNNAEASVTVSDAPGSKAKIQDNTQAGVFEASVEAQIQDKDVGEGATSSYLSLLDMSELRQMAANLGPLSDRSGVQLQPEPHVQPRNILSPSAGGELFLHSVFETMQEEFLPFDMTFYSTKAAGGSSLACDVPVNTFVMSAQAVEPFVAAANRIQLPQVEDELMLQDGDTLYKSLLSSQVKSLAIIHASLRQYREFSRMKADQDSLRNDLSALEMKVKEKEDALALSEKRVADLFLEKELLTKSALDFETRVASLEKRVEELDASLAKARKDNEGLQKLRLSDVCGQVRDALVSVGTAPDQLPEDASTEHYQAWLAANIPYVIQACRAFSKNAVHLAIRDLFHSLEAVGSDALAKAVSDSFSFKSTDITPDLIEALIKFADCIDESFWSRVLSIGQQPRSELIKCATSESSSKVSLSEFATPDPSSHELSRREPPIEIFSSPLEIYLSSDSDPLSPIEGGVESLTFHSGSLVAVGRLYNSGSDAPKGRHVRCRRESRGRRSRGASSSSRGSTRKKRDGCSRRNPPADSEGPSSCFDAASHVERMNSSGVVDPVFQRPYSPSSGFDIYEFS